MWKYFPLGLCLISKGDEQKSAFLIFYYLILELIPFARWICFKCNLRNNFLSVSKTHTCDSSMLLISGCNEYELSPRSLLNQSPLPSSYSLLFSPPSSFSFILSLLFPPTFPTTCPLLPLLSITHTHIHTHLPYRQNLPSFLDWLVGCMNFFHKYGTLPTCRTP